ncbi:lysophospholipid acyltransferase family protein [Leptolyngbya sp. 7M]|uniref:lysophospholipid acyltransferase family protein n=1 Tax=Leptolyngbya sp. 7M TaxID=2812896 RepID=UPI001B8D9AA4|nr:lysophospholipid acyltransferase family protein [Leptolyngbya sp. 7M]QYO66636.1 lysophospholipid acyltransferase family protein [Leptolyngbya sp. 7M]
MRLSIKKLRLIDLFRNRKGTLTFRLVLAVFGIALKLFFRRIETVNADTVPSGTGVIFVMNHPNGLIDPALVFVAMPRRISFLAKSTLFKMPVISFLLRTVGALPVYRRIDAGEDIAKNQETFRLASQMLRGGGSIALFPEGVSHNSPKLLPAKTGAARIALGAVSVGDDNFDLRIVPVGLFYTSKKAFRSEALLHFGEPFRVHPTALDTDGQPPRDAVKELTALIEEELRKVTLNAETDAAMNTARIAEAIFSSSGDNENLGEKLEFLQAYIDDLETEDDPEDEKLRSEIHRFDQELNRYGIGPEHLSLAQFDRSFVVREAISRSWWLLLLLPFAVIGIILHSPAYQLCRLFSEWYSRHGADDVASTAKVLAGVVFMPATWLITALVVGYFLGWESGIFSIPISALFGLVALYTIEQFEDLRGWANAVALFLTKKEVFLRLFVERREMQRKLIGYDRQ